MDATLHFNLPEDNLEFELAQKAGAFSAVIHEMDDYLRTKLKYEELSEVEYKLYEEVRKTLFELRETHDVLGDY